MFSMLNNFGTQNKRYDIYDFIICCFLACGFIFYEERTTYLDNAYLLFNILDTANFRIEHHRFSAILPQIPAVIGTKLGLNIKSIAILLSSGYLVFHFLIYWLSKHVLKQKTLGIIYLMCLLLAMHESFFDMVTEAKLALGFGILYSSILLTSQLSNQSKLIFSILVLTLGVFAHPVFMLYFVVIILFYWVFKKQVFWQHFIIIGVLFFIKSAFFGASTYENSFYEKLGDLHVFDQSFLHEYMIGHIGKYYKLMILLIYLAATYLFRSNQRQELGLYLFAIGGIYFLLAIVNAEGESHMMLQKNLYILSFTALYPLAFFYDKLSIKPILNVLIPIVLLASLGSINFSSKKYLERSEHLVNQIKVLSRESNKLLIKESQIQKQTFMGTWALPYESVVLSSWKLNKSVILINKPAIDHLEAENNFIHLFKPSESFSQLNATYFNFSDIENYQLVDSTFTLK